MPLPSSQGSWSTEEQFRIVFLQAGHSDGLNGLYGDVSRGEGRLRTAQYLPPRFSPDNAGPSDHGGAGQTCSVRIRCSEDISAGY